MATTVSRRLVYVKRTKNPHAPLPRRQAPSDATTEQRARPATLAPRVAVRQAPLSRRARFARGAALFGGTACLAVALAAVAQSGIASGRSRVEETRPVVARTAEPRVPVPVTRAELMGNSLPTLMAERRGVSDEGFRASRYVQGR